MDTLLSEIKAAKRRAASLAVCQANKGLITAPLRERKVIPGALARFLFRYA